MKNKHLDTINKEILNKGFSLVGLLINISYYLGLLISIIFIFMFLFDLGVSLGLYAGNPLYNDTSDGESIHVIKNSFFTFELLFPWFYLYWFFGLLLSVLSFHYLRFIIRSFRKGEVFTEENLRRVKMLNYINIVLLFFGIFMSTIEDWLIWNVSYFMTFLILLKVYMVGYEVHEQKLKLEEENNLTI